MKIRPVASRTDGDLARTAPPQRCQQTHPRLWSRTGPVPGDANPRLLISLFLPPAKRDQDFGFQDHRPVPTLLPRDGIIQVLRQRSLGHAMDDGSNEGADFQRHLPEDDVADLREYIEYLHRR